MSRILLVDAEPESLETLAKDLASEGHAVETRASSREALALISENPPDLVLLDCALCREDGARILRRICEIPEARDTPVLFLTAQEDEHRCLEAGASDFLRKPVNVNVAMHKIRVLLKSQETLRLQDSRIESLEAAVTRRGVELAALHRRLELINDSKDLTLKIIVREISAPATGIAGIARLALLDEPDPEKRERLTALLNRNVEAMDTLLANAEHLGTLKHASALRDSSPIELVPVLAAVADLERKRLEERGLSLTMRYSPETHPVRIRSELLAQMLQPLVRMAALFADYGTPIGITLDDVPGELSLALSWSGERQNQGIVATAADLGNAVIQDLAAAGLMSEIFLAEKIARICAVTVVWDLRNRKKSSCTLLFPLPREEEKKTP